MSVFKLNPKRAEPTTGSLTTMPSTSPPSPGCSRSTVTASEPTTRRSKWNAPRIGAMMLCIASLLGSSLLVPNSSPAEAQAGYRVCYSNDKAIKVTNHSAIVYPSMAVACMITFGSLDDVRISTCEVFAEWKVGHPVDICDHMEASTFSSTPVYTSEDIYLIWEYWYLDVR